MFLQFVFYFLLVVSMSMTNQLQLIIKD